MTDDWRRCVVDPALRVLVELDLRVADRTSISPLSRAVLLGVPVAELKKYKEYTDKVDDHGRTALRHAVELGSLETTRELVESLGANVDISDANGTTALHVASARGDVEIVELLLRKTSKASAKDKTGDTPLIMACRLMNWEIVPKLAKFGTTEPDANGRTALHWMMNRITSTSDCGEAIEALITNTADLNAQDFEGYTPLHYAAERGLSDACQLLVKRGAKLNIADKKGETPLHKSVSRPTILLGKHCALQVLLDLKSDVSAKRLDGKTAHDIIASRLAGSMWTESQRVTFQVAGRRLEKAMEDMQKV